MIGKPGLSDGLRVLLRAAKFLLSHFGLVKYFLIPFAINVVIFGIGTYTFFEYYSEMLNAFVPSSEGWWALVYYPVAAILVLLFAIIMVFSFTVIGNLIASPFNTMLSQRTEEIVSGIKIDEKFSLKLLLWDTKDAITTELKKIGLLILIQLALLLLWLVPVIGNIAYAIASPISVIYFLCFEYMDFAMSRKRLPYSEKWKLIGDHKGSCLGMGFTFFLTTLVPVLNFFVMPLAVIGSTLMYLWLHDGISMGVPSDQQFNPPEIEEIVNDVLSD